MATSFENAVGAPATISLLGKDLQAGPISLAHLAAVAAEIRARVQDPFPPLAAMLAALPPDRAMEIFRDVHQRHQQATTPSPEQCLGWAMDHPGNFAFLLWLLLEDRYQSKFSRDEVFREIMRLRLEKTSEYLAIVQLVCETSGVGIMGKLIAAGTPAIPQIPTAAELAAGVKVAAEPVAPATAVKMTPGIEPPQKPNGSGTPGSDGVNLSGGISSAPATPVVEGSPPMQLPV